MSGWSRALWDAWISAVTQLVSERAVECLHCQPLSLTPVQHLATATPSSVLTKLNSTPAYIQMSVPQTFRNLPFPDWLLVNGISLLHANHKFCLPPRRTDFLYCSLSLPALTFLSPCCERFAWQRRARQSLTPRFACCVHLGSNNTYLKTWGCAMDSPRSHTSQTFRQKKKLWFKRFGPIFVTVRQSLAFSMHTAYFPTCEALFILRYPYISILLEVSEVSMK